MVEIIKNLRYCVKNIFCFGLHQNNPYQNPHDFQTMNKDIEIIIDSCETPSYIVLDKIEDIVDDMSDRGCYYMDEVKEGVRLVVVKRELLDICKNAITMNGEKTFKSDTCMICLDKEPNVLFCTCGHISICTDCRENLNDKNTCISCKETSQIIRNI